VRERGWAKIVFALLLSLLIPLVPVLRPLVPIEQTLLLVTPAMAACATVGWWMGGRAWLAIAWLGLAGWMLATPTVGASAGAYDSLARGWSLLLAASFGVVSVVGSQRPFFARALASTGLAFAVATGLLLFRPSTPAPLQTEMVAEYERRVDQSLQSWTQLMATPEWQDRLKKNADFAEMSDTMEKQLRDLPARTGPLFPALLALESLATLALAWGMYHRVSRARIGPPLSPLRDFRFNDQLIWGLVSGITLLVIPSFEALRVIAANLLLFFGMLYALRGLGVVTWFLAPGRLTMFFMITFALFMLPVLGVFALGIGLGDTWVDWRRKPRPTA
jgi:hypothetical protein